MTHDIPLHKSSIDDDSLTTILIQLHNATQRVLQHESVTRSTRSDRKESGMKVTRIGNLDETQLAYKALTQACQSVVNMFTRPIDRLLDLCWSYTPCVALQYISKHQLASFVPLDDSVSYEDVADMAGVDRTLSRRMLQTCMAYEVFWEPSPGYVAHTSMSELLVDGDTAATVSYNLEEIFPAASRALEASSMYPCSQERKHAAWNVAHGTSLPFFDFMDAHPERMHRFMQCMEFMAKFPGYEKDYIGRGFDWASLGKGTVVDVGGGKGHVSLMLSARFPQLKFKVQDMESVVVAARKQLEGTPSFDCGRVSFESVDMFGTQPVKEAAVYFLRFILHDYPDKYAIRILRNIVAAMGAHSRIVVAETIVPIPGTLPNTTEKKLRCMDMRMMLKLNAVERDLEGFRQLFKEVDPRLNICNVSQPSGSILSFMEVALVS